MKLPNPEEFTCKDCVIAGDECWLITPNHIGTKWTDENARFRSCIVRKSDNYVVSQSYKKFTNFFEQPDFQPWNKAWPVEATLKIDGSCLIVSRYKNEWILRTRGTTDARQMANGYEIDILMDKYPKFFKDKETSDFIDAVGQSWLFEWVTPNNVICIRESSEPDLILIGIVLNKDASYYPQDYLDVVAGEYDFKRPKRYHYNSIEECILDVDAWKGKEGVVLHSPDFQTLKKIKASEYLFAHKLCTGMRSIDNVIDLFLSAGRFTKYSDFYSYIETTLDFEIAEKLKDDILKITVAYSKIVDQLERVKSVVDQMRERTRKEQALDICQQFTDWRKTASFLILDNRPIDDKLIRKALEETII